MKDFLAQGCSAQKLLSSCSYTFFLSEKKIAVDNEFDLDSYSPT